MFYKSDSLTFRLRGLAEGDHPIDASTDAELLDIQNAVAPIRVTGVLSSGHIYVFRLLITANLRHTCDRCTEEFIADYAIPLEIIYSPSVLSGAYDDTGYIHSFDSTQLYEVDISDDVHDALLLAIPMKTLCKIDCEGIDLRQKDNNSTSATKDERFAVLDSLYEKLKEEERDSLSASQ